VTAPSRPRRPSSPPPKGRPPVVAVAPKLAERARTQRADRRRRRLRRVGGALAVLLPVAALTWLVLLSPVLGVDDVEVTGVSRLSPEQVVEAAAVEPGTPLARVDVGDVAERVRAALPPTADVRVRRVWPTTLRLQVTERAPIAFVERPDGALLVDAAGVGFATDPAPPPGVPVLELTTPSPEDPATRAALTVLQDLPPWLREQVGRVRASTASDVELRLVDERLVVWGEAGEGATKVAALEPLLRMEGTVFDVSAPGIVVRR
jgi:cell division protein FtsQ